MKLKVSIEEKNESETDYETAIDLVHINSYSGIYSFKTMSGFQFFIEHQHFTETSSYIDIENDNSIQPGNSSSENESFRAYTDVKEPLISLSRLELKEYFENYYDKTDEEKYNHPNYPKFSQYAEQLEQRNNLEIKTLSFSDEEIDSLISSTTNALRGYNKGTIDIQLPYEVEQKILSLEKEFLNENLKNSRTLLENQIVHAEESISHFIDKKTNEALNEMKKPRPKP